MDIQQHVGHDVECEHFAEAASLAATVQEQWERIAELEASCADLTNDNLRLDAQCAELARELLTAAQHERSRLATADHQRDLADRWLDIARSSLPAPPTVSDMAGSCRNRNSRARREAG